MFLRTESTERPEAFTIFSMLVIVGVMPDVHVEVNGLVIRRFVNEAEAMNALMMGNKFEFLANLVAEVVNLLPSGPLHLHSPDTSLETSTEALPQNNVCLLS